MQWPSSRLSHDCLMAELQWQCAHVLKACMTPGNLDLFLDYFVSLAQGYDPQEQPQARNNHLSAAMPCQRSCLAVQIGLWIEAYCKVMIRNMRNSLSLSCILTAKEASSTGGCNSVCSTVYFRNLLAKCLALTCG